MVQIFFTLLLALSPAAFANTIFEGYYKIYAGTEHVGFAIQKYTYDSKKKQFESLSYTRTNALAGDLTESLKAVAGQDMSPKSYHHTSTMGKSAAIIEARFNKGKMTGEIKTTAGNRKLNEPLPPNTILSSFLPIYMLNSGGIRLKTTYKYSGIAEEKASVADGLAIVTGQEKFLGQEAFKLKVVFFNFELVSYMNGKGEVLGTDSAAQGIRTELVATAEQATGKIPYNAKHLKMLFGEIPQGSQNELVKLAAARPATEAPPTQNPVNTPPPTKNQ